MLLVGVQVRPRLVGINLITPRKRGLTTKHPFGASIGIMTGINVLNTPLDGPPNSIGSFIGPHSLEEEGRLVLLLDKDHLR